MIWSSAWACGSDAGRQRPRGAGARLPRARPGRAAELRRRRRRRASSSTSTNPDAQAWWRDKVARLPRRRTASRASSSTAARSTSRRRRPTSGPTAAPAARCATTTRRLQAKIHHDALAQRVPRRRLRALHAPGLHRHAALGDLLGRRHPRQRDLRHRPGHRPRAAQRDHQPAARRLHGHPDLGLGHRRLLRVQGPRGVRALDRVQRLLGHHGDRRRRHARAVGHADRAALRRRR